MKEQKDISTMEIKYELDCDTYWDINNVLSYNAFMNVSMAGRGIGKTWQVLLWSLYHKKNTGKEFIYLRRYKSETKTLKTLLDPLVDNIKFIGDGNDGGAYKWNNYTLGYCKALSIAQNFKSNNFENVDTIIFDEAIIKQSISQRYLKDEVTLLLEFISTVFRHRKNCRIFILGNNLDFFNPYCEYFNIKVFNKKYFDKDRGIYIEYCDTQPKLREIEKETPLYKLSQNTSYHKYHYDNEVLLENLVSNSKKRNNDKLFFRIIMNTYTINVYIRDNGNWLMESKQKIINDKDAFILLEDNGINWYYLRLFRDKYSKVLQYLYYNKKCEFTDDNAQALLQMLLDTI